ELEDGWDEYREEKEKADQEIADAHQEIADGEKELDDMEIPQWYVLDRGSNQTYVEYEQDTDRIVAIGSVFPVIFFLVAALICLTTMTRMVEGGRTQIGILKALDTARAPSQPNTFFIPSWPRLWPVSSASWPVRNFCRR